MMTLVLLALSLLWPVAANIDGECNPDRWRTSCGIQYECAAEAVCLPASLLEPRPKVV